MLNIIKERLRQKYRTVQFPFPIENMPEKFMGLPEIKDISEKEFKLLQDVCPVDAFIRTEEEVGIDLGKCIFCGECQRISNFISFTKEYALASTQRQDLFITNQKKKISQTTKDFLFKKMLQKSLKLRQVSAGGCNACEADVNVLGTVGWDLGRYGIQFVASPRHADGILVTGPVTKNMEVALKKTYEAIAEPKIVIATGACAINGGPFFNSDDVIGGVDKILEVDLYIPGCPPHPATILIALLKFLDKLPDSSKHQENS